MTTQLKPDFILHTDPGHSWLQVPLELARQAEREGGFRFSTCSYQSDTYAFLEEDCDAPAFMVAMGYAQFNDKGAMDAGKTFADVPATEKLWHGDAPIRRKPEYRTYWSGCFVGPKPTTQMNYLRTKRAEAMSK